MFDYINCEVQVLVQHVLSSPAQRITSILAHHKLAGNQEVVDKILEARRLANIERAKRRIEKLS